MALSPASDQSDQSDQISDSSSVVYQHESFTTFASRILELAATLWPDSDFDLERLPGGGFHRIIGLTRRRRTTATCAACDGETQLIMRIPRFESARVDDEVAALYFTGRLAIPVPTVIVFDQTADNALGVPYMIQNRIIGTDLYSCFPTLPHSQKMQISRELGAIFRQMLEVHSTIGGRPVLDGEKGTTTRIAPIRWRRDNDDNNNMLSEQQQTPPSSQQQSPCQWLSALFIARRANDPSDTLWAEFNQMAHELDAGGYFSQVWYSLAHLDLAPRNILVDDQVAARLETLAQHTRPIITAILDWDGAVLAPCFLSCYPPVWLWGWRDDEDEDERTANEDPGTAQGRQLKMQFEEAAGTDYVRFAYGAPYRLARRLVRFALDGVRSNEDYKEAKAMLSEWAYVCSCRVK
jgi:hypothetical protein